MNDFDFGEAPQSGTLFDYRESPRDDSLTSDHGLKYGYCKNRPPKFY